MKRFYVDGPYGQIHGRRAGAGAPVLLLHQSPLSSRQFARALPFLAAAGFDAIAIDAPGFGQSDPAPEPPSIAKLMAGPVAAMDALGLERAHVVGHHTGATLAAAIASAHPKRVDKLVLHGYPLLTKEEIAAFEALGLGPALLDASGEHLTHAWRRRLLATPGWSDLEIMHEAVMDDLFAWRSAWHGHEAVFKHDHAPDLAGVKAQTLLLSNTGDDLHGVSDRVLAARPNFAFVALEGGNHDYIEDHPEPWAQAVARFLSA